MSAPDTKITREFCMPSKRTFEMEPVSRLLDRYCVSGKNVLDPFSGGQRRGTVTNDLNPELDADFHLNVLDFCKRLYYEPRIFDVLLFDPPYSPTQISRCYKSIGLKTSREDTQHAKLISDAKNSLNLHLNHRGIAITFGWNSTGFGAKRGYKILEILMLNHGASHNDTIVVVEEKIGGVCLETFLGTQQGVASG